jgi:Fe-S cluster assembly protein SufD
MMPPAPGGDAPDPESLLASGRRVLAQNPLPEGFGPRALFVDGHFCPALSTFSADESGIRFQAFDPATHPGGQESIRPPGFGELASPKQEAFTALNTAFAQGGGVLDIAPDYHRTEPIHLIFICSGSAPMAFPRLLVRAGKRSRATLVMDFLSEGNGEGNGRGLVNEVSEIFIEENASLECIVLEREGLETLHIGCLQVLQKRDSRFRIHTLSLGGALVRNSLGVTLADTGAEVDLRGLYLGSGSQHLDNHTRVDHAMPHTASRQVYKGILGERARGVFRGLVHVRPDAQKIDSSQSNKNLLLSDQARVDARPQLEIHADDVKCSHGSTTGKLDEEALFYLRSRGLAEAEGRRLLTRGFVAEICEALPGEALTRFAQDLVMNALAQCTGGETDSDSEPEPEPGALR